MKFSAESYEYLKTFLGDYFAIRTKLLGSSRKLLGNDLESYWEILRNLFGNSYEIIMIFLGSSQEFFGKRLGSYYEILWNL